MTGINRWADLDGFRPTMTVTVAGITWAVGPTPAGTAGTRPVSECAWSAYPEASYVLEYGVIANYAPTLADVLAMIPGTGVAA